VQVPYDPVILYWEVPHALSLWTPTKFSAWCTF
jgi:hypothetical protein